MVSHTTLYLVVVSLFGLYRITWIITHGLDAISGLPGLSGVDGDRLVCA